MGLERWDLIVSWHCLFSPSLLVVSIHVCSFTKSCPTLCNPMDCSPPGSPQFSSVQFIHLVVSDSLQSHESQHARLPCPSPTPRACSNSCRSSRSWPPTISSSVVPFSSCFQSFPASGSFPRSQLFTSGGQGIGVSASASVLPVNI